jgi:hypothetical protein
MSSSSSATHRALNYPFLQPPEEEDEIGRLGNYRVLRLLGEGGMGFVFLAEDFALRRQVALKVMKSEPNKPNRSKRFFREARATAKLKHEHLVPIYHAEQLGDTVFYAMELLEGESLATRLGRKAPIDVDEIIRIGREVATGLAFIHQQNLVHRDIKPANIWLEAPHGRVKILDLGLVRSLDENVALTRAGIVVGSLGFMSPEQARGEAIDIRSDLFSLGCVLYHLCTRVAAFQGNSAVALLTALATRRPRPVQELNPKIPQALAKLVKQLLAKDPNDRPESAEAVRDVLEGIAHRSPTAESSRTADSGRAAPAHTKTRPREQTAKVPGTRWARIAMGAGSIIAAACIALGLAHWFTAPPAPAAPGIPLAAAHVPDGQAVPGDNGNDDLPDEPPPEEKLPFEKTTGERVYLSDLAPAHAENWHKDGGFAEKLRREGKPTTHGLFAFLSAESSGPVSITYNLGKKYSSFYSAVSIWDVPAPKKPSITFPIHLGKKPAPTHIKPPAACDFSVFGDDKLLWQSKGVTAQGGRQNCVAQQLGNVNVLRITFTAPKNFRGVHAVWLEPHLGK